MPTALQPKARTATIGQMELCWALPAGRQFFTVSEAARLLHLGESTVFDLVDAQQLHVHRHNARGGGKRDTLRITRASLALYLAATADYDSPTILTLLVDAAGSLKGDRESLSQLRNHIDHLIRQS